MGDIGPFRPQEKQGFKDADGDFDIEAPAKNLAGSVPLDVAFLVQGGRVQKVFCDGLRPVPGYAVQLVTVPE